MYQQLGSTNILLYDLLTVVVSSLALLIFNLSQIRRKKLLLSDISSSFIRRFLKGHHSSWFSSTAFWAIVEVVIISLYQHGLVSPINKNFGKLVGTGANYFGMLFMMPILLLLLCCLIGVDPLKQIDLITPAYPLALCFMKLACFCHGCCNGIECTFGLYNQNTGLVEFPIQLVELGLALMIFVFLLLWRKKTKEGTLLPIYLVIYCATRFFSEFLRSEPDVIWRFKTYHILCMIGLIVGLLELLIVLKFGDKIKRFCSKSIVLMIFKKECNREGI